MSDEGGAEMYAPLSDMVQVGRLDHYNLFSCLNHMLYDSLVI